MDPPYLRAKPIRNSTNVEKIAVRYSSKIWFAAVRVTAIRITAIQISTMVAKTDAYFMLV